MNAPAASMLAAPGRTRAAEAHACASALYLEERLFCSEAVVAVVNELLGSPMPANVIRMTSGLAAGMGDAGCSCGGLTGAVLALGIVCGRESGADDWEPSFATAKDLHERFTAEFGGACCRGIVRRFGGMEGVGRHEHCAELTGRCAALVFEVAEDHGLL
jgi:C_GCAxxG_C_C family probable redox protein